MADRFSGRGLGVDLGSKRIGVALCDSNGTLATPYETVERSGNMDADHRRLLALIEESEAAFVVFGVPYALRDGGVGDSAQAILDEIVVFEKLLPEACELHRQDERLTTVTAERRLTEMGIKGKKRKQLVDQIAAAVILQTWLDNDEQ